MAKGIDNFGILTDLGIEIQAAAESATSLGEFRNIAAKDLVALNELASTLCSTTVVVDGKFIPSNEDIPIDCDQIGTLKGEFLGFNILDLWSNELNNFDIGPRDNIGRYAVVGWLQNVKAEYISQGDVEVGEIIENVIAPLSCSVLSEAQSNISISERQLEIDRILQVSENSEALLATLALLSNGLVVGPAMESLITNKALAQELMNKSSHNVIARSAIVERIRLICTKRGIIGSFYDFTDLPLSFKLNQDGTMSGARLSKAINTLQITDVVEGLRFHSDQQDNLYPVLGERSLYIVGNLLSRGEFIESYCIPILDIPPGSSRLVKKKSGIGKNL